MEKEINKRSIKRCKTLENKYIHKKNKINNEDKTDENIVTEIVEEKSKKDTFNEEPKVMDEASSTKKVGPFQLVVIKIPWYKKIARSLMGLLGFYYE